MAKIVSPPKPKRVDCNKCGATIEYLPEEVKTRTYGDYGGGTNVDAYIPCPRVSCPGEGIISSS